MSEATAHDKLGTEKQNIETFDEAEAEIMRRIADCIEQGMTFGDALAYYVDTHSNVDTETWANAADINESKIVEKADEGFKESKDV